MRLALFQMNPRVGDLQRNVATLLRRAAEAKAAGAQLLVAPELCLCGYPPRDLLEQPGFVADCHHALQVLVKQAPLPMLVGAIVPAAAPGQADPLPTFGHLANGAVLLAGGAILACHRKNLLPTYDVFDEARYFTAGSSAAVTDFGGVRLGLSVCEDLWNDGTFWKEPRYSHDPVARSCAAGAELLINISASPFERGREAFRRGMLGATARRHRRAVVYVNQVGGNDGLIFDGRSQVQDARGKQLLQLAAFAEDLQMVEVLPSRGAAGEVELQPVRAATPPLPEADATWEADAVAAVTLGLRDYMAKCGFQKVVLGLSGGIDSAVVACLAVQALGAAAVIGVALPSRYSSEGSKTDALALANALQIRCDTVPIEAPFASCMATLQQPFGAPPSGLTEENLQARLRGIILMAYANRYDALCLTTGNKSEIAVGYTTLYGDMCGALAPIADLYKTEVYSLAAHLNASMDNAIPPATLSKPPSAELRPQQRDADSLPPYPLLDSILRGFLEGGQTVEQLVRSGIPADTVHRVIDLLRQSEHKRRQMAPGLRLSSKAFGDGRRLPIAARRSVATPAAKAPRSPSGVQ